MVALSLLAWAVPATRAAGADEKEPAAGKQKRPALEIRWLEKGARIVLSRGPVLLAAAAIRSLQAPAAAKRPVLLPGEKWRARPPLALDAGRIRRMSFPLLHSGAAPDEKPNTGADARDARLSILLALRRMGGGARVLVSPTLTRNVGAPAPHAKAPDLELAIELFALSKKTWPQLKAVDVFDPRERQRRHEALPRPGGKPFRAIRLSFAASKTKKNEPHAPGAAKDPGKAHGARGEHGERGERVELARSAPADWTLTQTPRSLLLRQRLAPDPRQRRQPGTFEFYLGGKRDVRPPSLSALRLNKRRTPAWDFVEGRVRVYAGGADPYGYEELTVMAEVAFPDRAQAAPRVRRLPCYFYEGPPQRPAEGEFRFRFAPPEEGTYGVRIVALARGRQIVRGEAVAFQAGPPASHGFVRVKASERVFRFDDGRVFFPLGLNLAWPKERGRAEDLRQDFIRLARYRGNATRVWLSSWGLPLEGPKAGRFDPAIAAALDEVLLAAQARGIHVILVAENAHDLTEKSARHPYFHERGGPLLAPARFFQDPEAIRLFKRRLTYLAARYGAYRSLWAWELLNEADEVWPAIKVDPEDARSVPEEADRSRRFRRAILAWAARMAQHLDGMDAHRHPVTLSVAMPPDRPWIGLERLPDLAFIQAHGYVPEAVEAGNDRVFDAAAWIASWAKASRGVGRPRRPYLLGEFGYRAPHDAAPASPGRTKPPDRNARDREGLLLHNSLLAGLASGMAGAPMSWWWDRYVERHALWKLFLGPARFAEALADLATREGPGTLRALSNDDEKDAAVRILGRVGRSGQCVWLRDRRSTWARKLERGEKEPPAIRALRIRLPALDPGAYRVRWLNTWSGAETSRRTIRVKKTPPGATPGPLKLNVPPFRRDIAVLIEPLPLPLPTPAPTPAPAPFPDDLHEASPAPTPTP